MPLINDNYNERLQMGDAQVSAAIQAIREQQRVLTNDIAGTFAKSLLTMAANGWVGEDELALEEQTKVQLIPMLNNIGALCGTQAGNIDAARNRIHAGDLQCANLVRNILAPKVNAIIG